jgi:hypothetical protein
MARRPASRLTRTPAKDPAPTTEPEAKSEAMSDPAPAAEAAVAAGVSGRVTEERIEGAAHAAVRAEVGDSGVAADASHTASAGADGSSSVATTVGGRVDVGSAGAEARVTATREVDADGDSRATTVREAGVHRGEASAEVVDSHTQVVEGDDTTDINRRAVEIDDGAGGSAGAYQETVRVVDDDASDGDTHSSTSTTVGGHLGDHEASRTVADAETFEGRRIIDPDKDPLGMGQALVGDLGSDYTETESHSQEVTLDDHSAGFGSASSKTVDYDPTDGDLEDTSSDTRSAHLDDHEVTTTRHTSARTDFNPFDDGSVSHAGSGGAGVDVDGFEVAHESHGGTTVGMDEDGASASTGSGGSMQIGDLRVSGDVGAA